MTTEQSGGYVDPAQGLRISRKAISGSLADAAEAQLAKSNAQRGLCGPPEWHDDPLKVGFGAYHERLTYLDGCLPMDQLVSGRVSMVTAKLRCSDTEETVSFMLMPAQYDARITPPEDLRELPDPNVGEPGDFLMHLDKGEDGFRLRFLDAADLDGFLVERGRELTFPVNAGRGYRQLERLA